MNAKHLERQAINPVPMGLLVEGPESGRLRMYRFELRIVSVLF